MELEAWRASRILFDRSLLERSLKLCRRAGIERFVLECPRERRDCLERARSSEVERGAIDIVDSLNTPQELPQGLAPSAPCLVLSGDVVFLRWDLKRLRDAYSSAPWRPAELAVDAGGRGGRFAAGAWAQTLMADGWAALQPGSSRTPFAPGEFARVKMMESAAGERLDHITDNLVHVTVSCGIALGVYRSERAPAMPYLLGALLLGFGLCAVAVSYAFKRLGEGSNKAWLAKVERASGRDFAYLVLILAALNHLEYFVWGAAPGTYAAALLFCGFAKIQGPPASRRHARDSYAKAAAEKSYEA